MEQTALKERFLDEACMIFMKNMEDIDINRVKAVLTMALDGYTLQKDTTDVTVYEGDSNERLFKAFLVSKKVSGLSDKTIKQYAYQLKKIFEKIGKPAEEVTTNDLRVYFAKRELDDHISDVSRQNERRVLSSFYLWLQDEGIVPMNPVRKFPNIKTRKKKKEAFSDMDVEKIRSSVKSERQAAMIEILLSTGCRVSELCGIRVDELDGDSVVVHGKGNKDRTCYLTARSQIAIKNYMQTDFFKKRYKAGCPYLFGRKNITEETVMKPLEKNAVETSVKEIGKRAGVAKVHPHRFRRTCATMALKRGMPIEQVSKMLGHESIETTQIYLDLDEESLKNAHKRFVA